MNPKILIFLSCALTHVCSAMDKQEEPKARHALTHKLCREYTIWKEWARRIAIEQAMLTYGERCYNDLLTKQPHAPKQLQRIWREVQHLAGIADECQKPLYVSEDAPEQFFTMYTISNISQEALEAFEKHLFPIGFIRYALLHEACHAKIGNTQKLLSTELAYYCTSTKLSKLVLTLLVYSHYTQFANYLSSHGITEQDRQHEQLMMCLGKESETETDALALAKMDCQTCLRETAEQVGPFDHIRTSLGYASVEQITQCAQELSGRRCQYHQEHPE